jgi:NAD(P)-dependent dehydrogenase (short-subunit alcohol dehydrogenase family)
VGHIELTGTAEKIGVSARAARRTNRASVGLLASEARRLVAGAILYLASTDADWVTGVALPVDGGFLAA